MSDMLSTKGFGAGTIGNNDKDHVIRSQVQAAKDDDLGAQAIAKELGGLPVVAQEGIPAGSVRVVLASDYTGPGSGLEGSLPTSAAVSQAAGQAGDGTAPPPSPIITAGSDDPKCVN